MTTYSIAELWRYPVKSMGGERVESLELRTSAVVGDRRWAVRNVETGKIASAKRPRPYGQLLSWSAGTQADGGLVVVGPDGREFAVGTGELDAALTEALGEPVQVVEVEKGREETYGSEWPEIPGTVLSDVEVDLPVAALTEKTSFVDASAVHIIVKQSMKRTSPRYWTASSSVSSDSAPTSCSTPTTTSVPGSSLIWLGRTSTSKSATPSFGLATPPPAV